MFRRKDCCDPYGNLRAEGQICRKASCREDAYCDGVSQDCPLTAALAPGTPCNLTGSVTGMCGSDRHEGTCLSNVLSASQYT